MKAEQLEIIAKGMDRENVFIHDDGRRVRCREVRQGSFFTVDYDPFTNAEQCMEIMEKLKICVEATIDGYWQAIDFDNDDDPSYGKTIPEAICNAAYEHFKDKR